MKTVIITGASRGIGSATAKKFLSEGWFVIGTSTSGSVDIVHEHFVSVQLDLRKPELIVSAVETVKALGRTIDVLVNNAGTNLEDDGDALRTDFLRQTLEVNLIGTIDLTIALLPLLNAPSHIINISSMAASMTDPIERGFHTPAYKISKAALNMFTRTIGRQLAPDGIVVSSLDPGWVKTDMGGKEEAPREPEEAAQDIYALAAAEVSTGRFWLKGEERNW